MRLPAWFTRLRTPPAGTAWCIHCTLQGGTYTSVLSMENVYRHIEQHVQYDPLGQCVRLKLGGVLGRIQR